MDEKEKMESKKSKQERHRKVSVKNPTFFLYKKVEENGDLSPLGSYGTEVDLRSAYESALDRGVPDEQLIVFKGRFVAVLVKETKRRIAVK